MDPLVILISATVLLAVISLVLGISRSRAGDSGRLGGRLDTFRQGQQVQPSKEEEKARLRRRSYSELASLNTFLSRLKGSEKLAIHLARSGVPLRVGEYYLIRLAVAALFLLIPIALSPTILGLLLGAILAMVGYVLPAAYIGQKKRSRLSRMNNQLVEMLDLVSNSLKSGYGLMQSFDFAAQQMRPPLAGELRRMLREANLGLGAEKSLESLGERVSSADLDMVLTAISIQRVVGGNLSEILESVSFTMRERARIRGEVKTLTSQGIMTGYLIGGMPVGVGLLFLLINPGYMSPLVTETIGQIILLAAAGLEILGIVMIKRILAIEI
jgi:tight adherence protein B